MNHVREIKAFIEGGEHEKALNALDDLLLLGPGNLDALKLKAFIFHQKGQFRDEEKVWQNILERDAEDIDAIDYLYRRHIEEREHFYFTDDLPNGRRYLANPRSVMNMTLILLMGCMIFLMLSSYSRKYLFLANAQIMLIFFGVLVILPLIGIVATYVKSLRDILVSSQGMRINTLLRAYQYEWQDFEKIYLVHDLQEAGEVGLALLLIPRNTKTGSIEINLSPDHSSIRARTFFINEIKKHFGEILYSNRADLGVVEKSIMSF